VLLNSAWQTPGIPLAIAPLGQLVCILSFFVSFCLGWRSLRTHLNHETECISIFKLMFLAPLAEVNL